MNLSSLFYCYCIANLFIYLFLHISKRQKCSLSPNIRCVSSGPININRHLHTWAHFIEFQTRHAVVCGVRFQVYLLCIATGDVAIAVSHDDGDAARI